MELPKDLVLELLSHLSIKDKISWLVSTRSINDELYYNYLEEYIKQSSNMEFFSRCSGCNSIGSLESCILCQKSYGWCCIKSFGHRWIPLRRAKICINCINKCSGCGKEGRFDLSITHKCDHCRMTTSCKQCLIKKKCGGCGEYYHDCDRHSRNHCGICSYY